MLPGFRVHLPTVRKVEAALVLLALRADGSAARRGMRPVLYEAHAVFHYFFSLRPFPRHCRWRWRRWTLTALHWEVAAPVVELCLRLLSMDSSPL